jgi:predicted transposase/invertase (TIGR01784 family)
MRLRVDPRIDCVFKALLGAEDNSKLLVHFLNAVLGGELAVPIAEVQILNPYNEREFIDDKLSVVDVKARDEQDQIYQIEVQLLTNPYLRARILYGWTDLYSQQLKSGQDYRELHPAYSIWLVEGNLIENDQDYARDYQMRDVKGHRLLEHGGIWLLELGKFEVLTVATERERWLRFFKEGEDLDDEFVPAWMDTAEMRQAMGTLRQFSEKERQYHAYQARQNFLRQQRTIQAELEEAQHREQAAQHREQAAQQREQAAQQEKADAQQREQAAQREKAEAQREKAEAQREKAEAQHREQAAQQEKAEAQHREQAAQAEIERLKALLAGGA